ncbi:unnamed protein product [Candidula unifasciata]|uniref:P-type domain-containing protein n=1 Tax=Candidula unifasciata TaxID=100452 RepID=A0A8S3ZPR2_9EUPU|nr:unnamed protein product [Candidula unifasciata]
MAAYSSFLDQSASLKFNRINNTATIRISDEKLTKETRCGKYLRRIVNSAGYLFVLCLFALACLHSYKFVAEVWNVNVAGKVASKTPIRADQCSVDENNRFDCFPEKNGATESLCLSRGCCWKEVPQPDTAPFCFYPTNYSGYTASNVKQTATGITATLQRLTNSPFPRDVKTLQLFVEYQTETRLRIKIYDPNSTRYEVPLDTPSGSHVPGTTLYTVTVEENPFNIVVTRTSTGATIFDTRNTAPLIFSDQFLQIGTQLSTKYLYGFGEHRNNFLQDVSKWRRLVFWTRDNPPQIDNNGYGSHPFFLNLETGGPASNSYAHGVFLLNSNAGEVVLQPFGQNQAGAVTYHFLGGILDFYIFTGPSPIYVAAEYAEVIGLPYFPPFWSLGYHLCKWGYDTSAGLKAVIDRNRQAQIPYDVQWNDIDYMNGEKDWTYDHTRFGDLPSIVEELHANNQRYIIMADPAISNEQPPGTYPPYDDGVQLDVFVKNDTNNILIGQVWPGKAAFPDFFHPKAVDYLYKQAKTFHDQLQFDGLWIDMNEPSNFVDGSVFGCTNNQLNNPPFIPPTIDGGKLQSKTLCPSAKQAISTHYNLHNMYGWSQANVTRRTLNLLYGGNKRSVIISRSSFAGSGKNTGHWLGDNHSSFSEMFYSVPGILNFNLFGIPQIGADICGFGGTTTPELCTRWHQLAAFYPFMRNHADIGSPAQDPGSFQPPFRDYIKTAIELRYRLLAVLYTAFYRAHTQGLPIVRPLFYLYPGTETIDKQFMWSDQLLVSPVFDQGATTVQAFIPDDVYYDFNTGALVSQRGQTVQLNASIDHINVHVRGGSILPLLPVTQRTDLSRQEKFQLLVAVAADGSANGELFWDDGESIDSITGNKYSQIYFNLTTANHLDSLVIKAGYSAAQGVKLGSVTFYGINNGPGSVSVNGAPATFDYDAALKIVRVTNLDVDLLKPLSLLLN